jgi:para-aminobenzoate synthetase/4-amino-4-deoxychorismate lyase
VNIPGLFETMRYSTGPAPDQLDSHLARIQKSASYFDMAFDRDKAHHLVTSACVGLQAKMRVRLAVADCDEMSVEISDFPVLNPPVRLALAARCVDSSDIRLRHKISDRSPYEALRSSVQGADDVIMHNEKSEVTETTIANFVFRLDGRWWTPPCDCGLLPGVERMRLVSDSSLGERVLHLDELEYLDEIAVVGALRGWQQAILTGS